MLVKYEPWKMVKEDIEIWGVKILDGEYEGTALSINELETGENDDGLVLDYTVVKYPEGKEKDKDFGPEFDKVLNFIIEDILKKAMDEYENRNRNSAESSE